MPEYDYRCKNCQEISTIEKSMSAQDTVAACSHCGSSDLARIWSANFVGVGSKKSAISSSSTGQQMCASDPAKPKSCCPCS